MNDPYAKHVGSVISDPFNCEYCHRQYASRAKLLNHRRKNHSDLLLADQKVRHVKRLFVCKYLRIHSSIINKFISLVTEKLELEEHCEK